MEKKDREVVSREDDVEQARQSNAEERWQQDEVAEVEEARKELQEELGQDEEWDNVESTGTEGEEKIGSAREAFEPREREEVAKERRNSNGGKTQASLMEENRQLRGVLKQ